MLSFESAAELSAHLESEILSGRLAPGDRLDPVRSAAAALGLAPNTVASAYRTLSDRGLVIGRGRRGTIVADRRPTFAPEPLIPEDAVDLASGNPDPELLPDLGAIVNRIEVPGTLYGDEPVMAEFEQAVRAHLVDPPGEMAVVSGALDGIERVLAAHLRPGDQVGIENPGWPAMADLVRAMLLRPVPIDIDEQGLVPESLQSVVGGLDAVVLTSRVQNPTGACTSAGRAKRLVAILDGFPDLLVVEDDHAGPISGSDLCAIGPGRRRWALAASVSKAIGPDLRIAALFGDPATIEAVRGRQGVGPGWVSHLLQRIAGAVISEHHGTFVRATDTYHERREGLLMALAAQGLTINAPSGLNVWVPVPDPASAVASCLEAGYAVRSGDAFVLDDSRAVRVTTSRMTPSQASDVARVLAGSTATGRRHTRSG
jgi:DNA-binding transcriptional MocR family regulator